MEINNTDDVIDSRDVIERIEELEIELQNEYSNIKTAETFEEWIEDNNNELIIEYCILKELSEKGEQYSDDWEYGVPLIRESHFEEYIDEMIADCYSDVIKPDNLPFWMTITYDYKALKRDYTEVDFDGVMYFIR